MTNTKILDKNQMHKIFGNIENDKIVIKLTLQELEDIMECLDVFRMICIKELGDDVDDDIAKVFANQAAKCTKIHSKLTDLLNIGEADPDFLV